MSKKGSSSSSTPAVSIVAPTSTTNSFNADAYTRDIQKILDDNSSATLKAIEASNISTPATITPTISMDYLKANKEAQDKIDKELAALDTRRKGVLGTVLTSLSDEDPDALTTLLGGNIK